MGWRCSMEEFSFDVSKHGFDASRRKQVERKGKLEDAEACF